MKALLLAAGLGSRLRPITDTIPKCLVPIDGKPLLEYWLDLLTHAGIAEFYINVFYHADAVREFIAQSPHKEKIIILEEEELLGTGGTLKKNASYFSDAPFFLAHADNLCLTNFREFINAHQTCTHDIAVTMMAFNPPDPKTCGVVGLDQNNIVMSFHEKVENPPSNLANGAVFVMNPEIAIQASRNPKNHFEISLDIIPNYMNRILAWHNTDYHLDIGLPQTYQQAQNDADQVRALYQKYMHINSGG